METASQWLIRTADNLVAGPYSGDQVRQLIRDGQLGLQDEVCPANGYWIFLHEREEVQKFLSVEVPKSGGPGGAEEEDTETEITSPEPAAAAPAPPNSDSIALPELEPTPTVTPEEQTAMLSNAALKRFQAKKKPDEAPQKKTSKGRSASTPPGSGASIVTLRRPVPGGGATAQLPLGQVERPSFWRGFAWLLVAGIALVVYAVLRIIRLS